MSNKKMAYFQGGGGVNEPTPGKKKYKSDPALVVQPRFKEPFYRNYDLYTIPGMEDVGPGTGWHGLQDYNSVQEFLEARRKRLKPRYVSDDSWQLDSGERTKKQPKMAMRMAIFDKIIKQARMPGLFHKLEKQYGRTHKDVQKGDDNDGPNFDYGHGAYDAMNQGKKMKTITDFKYDGPTAFAPIDHKNKQTRLDSNNIDFPLDDQINAEPIEPSEESYHNPTLVGPEGDGGDMQSFPGSPGTTDSSSYINSTDIAGQHGYLPQPDSDGKSGDALNFGRDYDSKEETNIIPDNILEKLTNKYLTPKENSIFGLPDGIFPQEDLDPSSTISDENSDYGTTNSGNTSYDVK